MKSMTGYGSTNISIENISMEIIIKSVNGKFLETRFSLPQVYMALENDLKKKLKNNISRGFVSIYLNRHVLKKSKNVYFKTDTELAKRYISSYKKLSKDLKIDFEPDLKFITQQMEVISLEEKSVLSAIEKKTLFRGFEKALQILDREREREGRFLCKEIKSFTRALEQNLKSIEKLRDRSQKFLKEKYTQRLKELMHGEYLDQGRLAQEIAILVDKADITEEISRLREHLRQFQKLLDIPGFKGKKLDFYTQELLREINTIGSKSYTSELTKYVVEAKSMIEKIREQVQNIE